MQHQKKKCNRRDTLVLIRDSLEIKIFVEEQMAEPSKLFKSLSDKILIILPKSPVGFSTEHKGLEIS